MMARIALLALGLGAAAAFAAGGPARAQCRLCESPTATSEAVSGDRIIALEIESSLDFDKLVVLGRGDGSATLGPNGARQVSGTIEALSGRAMVGEARVRGEPNRAVRIDLPQRIELHSANGGRLSIEDILTDLPSVPRLDSAGNLSFRFGGRIRVTGDEEGDYRGDLPMTAEYL